MPPPWQLLARIIAGDPDVVAQFKVQKNALVPIGRLPQELLAHIFLDCAYDAYATGWPPLRRRGYGPRTVAGEKDGDDQRSEYLYEGWIVTTHVCHY